MSMNLAHLSSLLALAFAMACSHSPVSPTPTPGSPSPNASSVTGSWSGTYLAVCPNSPTCATIGGGGPVGPQAFALALEQNGDTLTGQITLTGWIQRAATVTGTIAPDGTMTLQGSDSWPALEFCQPAGECLADHARAQNCDLHRGSSLKSWRASLPPVRLQR